MGCDAAAGGPARVRGVHHAHDRSRLHRGQARHQVSSVQCPLLIPILDKFTFWQKCEFYRVQLTYGANHLNIHGN